MRVALLEEPGRGADAMLGLFEGLVLERLRGAAVDGASVEAAMCALLRGLGATVPERSPTP